MSDLVVRRISKYCLLAFLCIAYLFGRRQFLGVPPAADTIIMSKPFLQFARSYLPLALVGFIGCEMVLAFGKYGWGFLFHPIRKPQDIRNEGPRIWPWFVGMVVVCEVTFLCLSLA